MKKILLAVLAVAAFFAVISPIGAVELSPGLTLSGQWYELDWGRTTLGRHFRLRVIEFSGSVAKVEYYWSKAPNSDKNDSGTWIFGAKVSEIEGGARKLEFITRTGALTEFIFDPQSETVRGKWSWGGSVWNTDANVEKKLPR
jgi:hypothetical protein